MKPSDFPESNADYIQEGGDVLKAFLGRLPKDRDDAKPRIVSRWRPAREEVEALIEGASVWLHVVGREHMPPVGIGCYDPFQPVVHTGSSNAGRPIEPGDPLEIVESLAALDTLRALFKLEGARPEVLVEKIVMYVRAAEKMRKGLR